MHIVFIGYIIKLNSLNNFQYKSSPTNFIKNCNVVSEMNHADEQTIDLHITSLFSELCEENINMLIPKQEARVYINLTHTGKRLS